MENRKGNGIFLGIVSVATLIVAIIGATFAYFSASTQSNEGAVGATAYEYKLSLSVSPVYPKGIAPALIPMDADAEITVEEGASYNGTNKTNLLYALNEAANKCVDDHGLQVCVLYQVKIENQAVNDITLKGQLITNTNTPGEGEGRDSFENLTYQALSGSHENNTLKLEGSAVTIKKEETGSINIADIFIPGATEDEDGELVPGVGTSYVLIYLNDNEDQSKEMGASFTGQLKYNSGEGDENGLTGSFTISAPEEEPDAEE